MFAAQVVSQSGDFAQELTEGRRGGGGGVAVAGWPVAMGQLQRHSAFEKTVSQLTWGHSRPSMVTYWRRQATI